MVGRTVSHYRIVEQLGGGGMGVVYKATDLRLNRTVALKFLASALTRDPEANQRFRLEAQSASALDHPNICTIHEIDETPDHELFMVMAYYAGDTLKHRIAQGPLSVDEALDITIQIARALARAHGSGLIHRDIKPANLMLAEGLIKILDFGLVKLAGESDVTRTGTTVGTVAYMSPEQIRGSDVDAASDVWSLGVVLYEMLAGRRPFIAKDDLAIISSILGDAPPAIETLRHDVPPPLRRVIARALDKTVKSRYRSAAELLTDLEACRAELRGKTEEGASRAARRRGLAAVAAVIVAIVVGSVAFVVYRRGARERHAREVLLPQIQKLIAADSYVAAFALAKEAETELPANDPALSALWPRISAPGSITSSPPGATVSMEEYGTSADAWTLLGQTPLDHVKLPLGTFRFKLEKPGFETRLLVSANPGVLLHNLPKPGAAPPAFDIALAQEGSGDHVVQVPGGAFPVSLSGFNTDDDVQVNEFLVDQYEVTNEAFKRFVDGAGYTKADNWSGLPDPPGGGRWPEAAAAFRDSTGRPGPSTWELGRFPAGQAEFPVGGVSWFEAAAYCRSQGKTLPTVFHWARAALSPVEILSPLAPAIIPASNFSKKGPARVGESRGLGPYGTYDMAGNVREWTWNESEGGRRWMLGGSWNDQPWLFVVPNTLPPLDRSATNGFRCVRLEGDAQADPQLTRVLTMRKPQTKPVSAEVFEVFKRQFQYARTPVDVRVESTDTSSPDWIRERLTVGAGDGERTPAVLFLPRNAAAPFQLTVFFPGLSDFVGRASSDGIAPGFSDYIVKSGRALLVPVWKGSYERWDPFLSQHGDEYLRGMRVRMAEWRQDLGHLLDGLAGRKDIDVSRTAFVGVSFGSSTMFPLLALEERFKTAILFAPGYTYRALPPEADAVNYASRVTVPVLMVGGRHDYVLPLETSQKPMFNDLGTPADRKRHVIFDTGHVDFPRSETIREALGWLDTYLGPVQTK